MKHEISIARQAKRRLLTSAIATCLLACAPNAFSQAVSASLRGHVLAGEQPVPAATVTAINNDTGFSRKVQSDQEGNYLLAGLPPLTPRER